MLLTTLPRRIEMTRSLATHLMFDGQASEAIEFYARVFPQLEIRSVERYGPDAPNLEGTVRVAELSLRDHRIIVIDSPVPHDFSFTPAVSLFVECDTVDELDRVADALCDGGTVHMPPGDYGFSERFAWCQDRYGVSWQVNFDSDPAP
jgi:predicted 3-demethylubiquinone-9 3-methyltransferase (glyoxalase superfamily)